jgi:hypothetical protein
MRSREEIERDGYLHLNKYINAGLELEVLLDIRDLLIGLKLNVRDSNEEPEIFEEC